MRTPPADREATADLLGVLAYGELVAFERLAGDARLAPSLGDRSALAGFAAREYGDFVRLTDHLGALGIDAEWAMGPFVAPMTAFHDSTRPSDWWEGLMKAYVGDGIATDFYREVAALLEPATRDLVVDVLGGTELEEFCVDRLRAGMGAEPGLAGRLALWGRRLVGEAMTQAQHVAVERDGLTRLLVAGLSDVEEISRLLTGVTDRHQERMAALGLSG